MDIDQLMAQRVHNYYWEEDINCATTTLRILSELTDVKIHPQVIDGAVGLHGAGGFGAQCGLVEGILLFIGIAGRKVSLSDEEIIKICYSFADKFQQYFGSLSCKQLRPSGTGDHLCEELTNKAVKFSINFVINEMGLVCSIKGADLF